MATHPLGCAFAGLFLHSKTKRGIMLTKFASFRTFWPQNNPYSTTVTDRTQVKIQFSTDISKAGLLYSSGITFKMGQFYTTLIAESKGLRSLHHDIMVGYSSNQITRKVTFKHFSVRDNVSISNSRTIFLSWESEKHST